MILKIVVSFLILFCSFSIFATGPVLDLNNKKQIIILDSLNNICGDTWCEGEYDIKFISIQFILELVLDGIQLIF